MMLEVEPRNRCSAKMLLKEPYILGDDIRMTAFEMAGKLSRLNGGKNFTRDQIKVAHNEAVENLVSRCPVQFVESKPVQAGRD